MLGLKDGHRAEIVLPAPPPPRNPPCSPPAMPDTETTVFRREKKSLLQREKKSLLQSGHARRQEAELSNLSPRWQGEVDI